MGPATTLGSPLVSPAAAGCHVPVDRRQRLGESAWQKKRPQPMGMGLGPIKFAGSVPGTGTITECAAPPAVPFTVA
jgi:hypothetical protein